MRGWKRVEGPGVEARRRRDVRRWVKRPFRRRIWGAGCQSGELRSGDSTYEMSEEGSGLVLRARQMANF